MEEERHVSWQLLGTSDLIFKKCSIPLLGCHLYDVERTVLMIVFDVVEEVLII